MKGWGALRGLPREVWILFLATLVNRMGTMALPFLVLYLTRDIGLAAATAGGMLALYGATSLVASPLGGRLADRFSPLAVLKVSLFGTGVLTLVYPLARHKGAVAALTVLWAFANELYRPASMSAMTTLVPPEKRRSVIALGRLAVNLGMSVGPAIGGVLASVSFPALFAVDGATSILAGLVLFAWRHPPARAGGAHAAAPSPSVLSDRRLLYFLLALLPVAVVFFQHTSAMALFLVRDLGFSERTYGLLFTVNTLLIVALEVPLNEATGRMSHGRVLAAGSLLCGIGFGLLAVVRSLPGVIGTVVVWTFGEMVLLPGMGAYVADLAPAERRGAYMGLYTMTFGAAFALGPWLGTFVLSRLGATVLWSGAFALGALSAALLLRAEEPLPRPA
jgi:predicted MFS family arabinose efflux permease